MNPMLGMSSSVTVPFDLEVYLILDISNECYDRAFFLLEQFAHPVEPPLITFLYSALIDLTWE